MSKMVVIGREQEVFAFCLLGAQVQVTPGADETREAVERLIADRDVSVLLVTEEAAGEAEDMIKRFRFQHPAPVMVIPTPLRAEGRASANLRKLIEEAVGTDLLGEV